MSKASDRTGPELPTSADGVVLLTGGNPQIAKGDGDAPVQRYIAAMPGWKSAVGRQLDSLIVQALPSVAKAVRWNSAFYGLETGRWFLSFRCITRYVKVAFYRGTELDPMPPVGSKHQHVRYLHVFEDAPLPAAQFTDWVLQASRQAGVRM